MRLAFVFVIACAACSASPELASSPDADRVFPCDKAPPGPTGSGTTFSEIYAELISTTSVTRCQDAACHGGSAGQGGLSLGSDKNGAYEGMKAYSLVQPDAAKEGDPPPNVRALVNVVKPLSNGKPRMPRELCGNRALNPAEIQRIVDWGKAGALNN